jgi:predicted phage-related endonuclease
MSDQRSAEWIAARCGKVGCSRLADVLATTKSGEAATRRNYTAELICERLTGLPTETITTTAMQWGIDTEPLARQAYEHASFYNVVEDFGREHPSIPGFRGSPDGLVGDDGGVEIKCPKTATHLDTILGGTIKRDYILQMAGYVSIYDRKWWDYVSYDPRLPPKYALFIKRFTRDELPVSEVEEGVKTFLAELNEKMKRLEEL